MKAQSFSLGGICRLLISSIALLFLLGVASSAKANESDFAVTLYNATGNPTAYVIGGLQAKEYPNNQVPVAQFQPGQNILVLPRSQWMPPGSDQNNAYIFVTNSPNAKGPDYCQSDPIVKGSKFSAGGVYSIVSAASCPAGASPEPPPQPETIVPVISDLPQSVEMNEGESRVFLGSLLGSNGSSSNLTASAAVTGGVSASHGAFEVKQPSAGQLELKVSSPQEGNYQVAITATYTPSGESVTWHTYVSVIKVQGPVQRSVVPRTVSAWIYDASGNPPHPGQFIDAINDWNNGASSTGNKITELHTYGTDMEMYGEGDSRTLHTFYVPTQYKVTTSSGNTVAKEYVGPLNVIKYKQGVPDAFYMSPIVDGRTDTGYLKQFNNLSTQAVVEFADLLSMQVCLDDRVNGLQIDVEPLDFTAVTGEAGVGGFVGVPTQVAFYLRLADNFSSIASTEKVITQFVGSDYQLDALPLCQYKHRYVSVFTFASKIEQAVLSQYKDDVVELLSRDNFLVIDSLYDLPPGTTASDMTDPGVYYQYVINEVTAMADLAEKYNFNFKFAIPASCSFHECDQHSGGQYKQVQYALAALNAIAYVNDPQGPNAKGRICNNPNFKGIAIWAFDNNDPVWDGKTFNITAPTSDVVDALTKPGHDVSFTSTSPLLGNKTFTWKSGMSEVLGCNISQ